MTENDIIEKYLKEIHSAEGGYRFDVDPSQPYDRFHPVNIVDKLNDLGLIKKLNKGAYLFVLTDFGDAIIAKGGWKKHLTKEAERKLKAERKEHYDYLMSKWKYITFWFSLFLGTVGGFYSIYKMIFEADTKEKQEWTSPKYPAAPNTTSTNS